MRTPGADGGLRRPSPVGYKASTKEASQIVHVKVTGVLVLSFHDGKRAKCFAIHSTLRYSSMIGFVDSAVYDTVRLLKDVRSRLPPRAEKQQAVVSFVARRSDYDMSGSTDYA